MTPESPLTQPRSQLLFGALALALGIIVLASADLFPAWALRYAPPLAYVGPNTGLCFVLCGAALLLAGRAPRRARQLAPAAGLLVLLLAAGVLLQPWHGVYAPGIGWQHLLNAGLARTDARLWPGTMRPSAALAFLLAGLGLLLLPRRAGRRAPVRLLGVAVAAVALPSVFSNMLGNVLFDGGPGRVLLPVPTALGLVAVGLGLYAAAPSQDAPSVDGERENHRIFVTGLALFSAMSLVASMVGIGLVGRYVMSQFEDAWLASFRSNAELLRVAIERAASGSEGAARFSRLDEDIARGAAPAVLRRELERMARFGHFDAAALWVQDAAGRTLARSGDPRYAGQFSIALPLPLAPRLYWQDGWRLLTGVPLARGARVMVDVALADFNRQYALMNMAGRTREARICASDGREILCFPSRLHPQPARFPLRGGGELPMARAIGGASGVAAGPDYRGQEVIAAYGMVAGTGLALVQKVDADEFYHPLRRQLWIALFGMALLVLAGALVLYARTHPLALGLVRARARLRAILHNVPAGVLTFDAGGAILSANHAACALFGYDRAALLGMGIGIGQLVPDARLLQGAGSGGALQLAGRARDGRELALEVVANQFMLGDQPCRIAIVQDIGQRLRMEQALRQREASLAHAQQLAHIGSWERIIASGAYYWSDETYRIFGMVPGAPVPGHDTVTSLVHPDDRALKLDCERDAIAGLRDYDVSFRILLPGGVVKVIHSRAEVDVDGAGHAVRFRGTIQDITDKAWADQQLRKREEEYRALVEHSPDVVVRFDRELRCVYVNPAIAAAPGLRDVIAYGRMLDASHPGAACAPWARAVRAVLESGKTGAFEVAVGGADARHYQVQVVPEFRQRGRVAAVLATARDITAIRNGEAVLRENEQRLAGIAANTPGAMFQLVMAADGARTVTYISEGVAQLLGVERAAVLACDALLFDSFHPGHRAAFEASMACSARTLGMLDWEGRARTAGGSDVWINCRATPRRSGRTTIWEGVMLNITSTKRNEEQLTASRQLLRELSAHSEQVREEERKKVAREVHDELGQALTALRMDVALLRLADGPHSPALLARIAGMKEAVDRTIGIVRNVTAALRPAALDLGLTAALEWQVEDFARRSGIVCLLHAGDAEVVLDDSQATALFRIVQESLTNVLKHAAATEVQIALDARGDAVRLEVRDNGAGFAAGAQPEGGKFGLMGMRERVLMLGGTVEIRSQAGAGTCILVRLPLTTQPGVRALQYDE